MPPRLLIACLLLGGQWARAQQPATASDEKCALEGTVVDLATGEAIAKAAIRLTGADHSAPARLAVTDASGNFRFEQIAPGEYTLRGGRTGYLESEFGARSAGASGTPLRLKRGDKLTGLILKLARGSIISGKVSDENGDPIAKAMVYAVRREWLRGQPQYSTGQTAWTNDAGEYRLIGLTPGHYYLCAEVSGDGFVEKQGGQEKRITWRFYPRSPTLESAEALTVQSGQELRGINFEMCAEPVFHIRGRLVGKGAETAENRPGVLAYPHGVGTGIIDLDGEVKADGSFDFAGAPAGSYDLELQNDEYKQTITKITIVVKKSDVNGLVIPVPNRFDLAGLIHVLDAEAGKQSPVNIFARDLESPAMSHPYWAEINIDGSFRIENIWPGKYVFEVEGMKPGEYVKSIQYDGEEILGVPIELARSAGRVEITLSSGAGEIEGSVEAAEGVAAGGVDVVLVSEVPRVDHAGLRVSKTDEEGRISLKNLAPGIYYALALADIDSELLENRDFVAQLQGDGLKVEVPENGKLQVHVPLPRAADVARALSALGL
jgi:protocatechuate 3,4-dioxygenase beta subunit